MATTSVTSTRIVSVLPNPQHPQCAVYNSLDIVSLRLEVYITHRSGDVFTQNSIPIRPTPIPIHTRFLEEPAAMRSILGNVLRTIGLVILDHFLDALASTVLHRFLGTGSARLCAKLEVVITDQKDMDDAIAIAIERLKGNCGFESQGRELGTCSICLDELEDKKRLIRTPCSHLYHQSCIVSWLEKKNKSCPLCRTQLL